MLEEELYNELLNDAILISKEDGSYYELNSKDYELYIDDLIYQLLIKKR